MGWDDSPGGGFFRGTLPRQPASNGSRCRCRCRCRRTAFPAARSTQGCKKSVARTTITPAQLYAILDREFKQLRPPACSNCRVPLPYWRQPPDDVSANWHIGQPSDCPHGCHLVVAGLLARRGTRYDIEP